LYLKIEKQYYTIWNLQRNFSHQRGCP